MDSGVVYETQIVVESEARGVHVSLCTECKEGEGAVGGGGGGGECRFYERHLGMN